MAELFQEFSQANARTTREYMVAPAVGSRFIDVPPTHRLRYGVSLRCIGTPFFKGARWTVNPRDYVASLYKNDALAQTSCRPLQPR